MIEIPLGNSISHAVIDDADYELVCQYNWVEVSDHRCFYAVASVLNKGTWTTIKMHKLITGYEKTDHIDHNGLNNQRSNLRAASASENGANRRSNLQGVSGYKGVTWHSRDKKWTSRIGVRGARLNLGSFDSETAAAQAYDRAALENFGDFAKLNFPKEAYLSA